MILEKVIIDKILRIIKKKKGNDKESLKIKKLENEMRLLRTKVSKNERKLKEIENAMHD